MLDGQLVCNDDWRKSQLGLLSTADGVWSPLFFLSSVAQLPFFRSGAAEREENTLKAAVASSSSGVLVKPLETLSPSLCRSLNKTLVFPFD